MAVAWARLKGHADNHIRNNTLATRAASEENKRLRSDLEQTSDGQGTGTAGQGPSNRASRDR
eukprot:9122499-Pyramimonas_sp.AAC.1